MTACIKGCYGAVDLRIHPTIQLIVNIILAFLAVGHYISLKLVYISTLSMCSSLLLVTILLILLRFCTSYKTFKVTLKQPWFPLIQYSLYGLSAYFIFGLNDDTISSLLGYHVLWPCIIQPVMIIRMSYATYRALSKLAEDEDDLEEPSCLNTESKAVIWTLLTYLVSFGGLMYLSHEINDGFFGVSLQIGTSLILAMVPMHRAVRKANPEASLLQSSWITFSSSLCIGFAFFSIANTALHYLYLHNVLRICMGLVSLTSLVYFIIASKDETEDDSDGGIEDPEWLYMGMEMASPYLILLILNFKSLDGLQIFNVYGVHLFEGISSQLLLAYTLLVPAFFTNRQFTF